MSRRWLLSLFCLAVPLLLFVQLTGARGALTVNEAATRVLLRDGEPQVSLAVQNATGKPVTTLIRLELLDPKGQLKSFASNTFKLSTGSQKLLIKLPLEIAKLTWQESEELLWYRLRYHLAPVAGEDPAPASGVISLSEMTPDLFQIRVAGAKQLRAGMRYRATVQARHPLTLRPARGVRLAGTIEIDDDNSDKTSQLKAFASTDNEGFAVLDFDLPRLISSESLDLKIVAERGSLKVEEQSEIDLDATPFFFVTTDKPMYQPGQVLHARVLLFGPAKRAIGNAPVRLKINDPEGETLFRTALTTSRFGIASADWPIPESSRLGNYRIEFETEDEKSSSTSVKISRYELPNFTVNIKPNHSYYLPNQNADVAVNAAYLFGEPVKRGHVRIVRETERRWNYREQKYEIEEAEKYEGDTDKDGVYKAQIDLKDELDKLGDSDYERFRDLSYAAYFTDPTTNRTEQRRFDLRISREAIHVYIVKADAYAESARLPLQFYVSTFYADGTPAECRVVISDPARDEEKGGRNLRTIKTNRYGLAKVERLPVSSELSDGPVLSLNFLATDRQGKSGKHAEGYYLADRAALRVETDKTLYAPGEAITVTLTSSENNATALLQVTHESGVVYSNLVHLSGGRTSVTLPWTAAFRDELTISALSHLEVEENCSASHTILFPRNRELKVGVSANQQTYRPGTAAQVNFRVRDPQGRAASSALGVVIFDKAVEERARTDQEFGSGYNDTYRELLRWFGNGDSIAGIGRRELENVDLSKTIDPEFELAAEVMLNQNGSNHAPHIFGGDGYETSPVKVFLNPIKSQLEPVRQALEVRYKRSQEYPKDEAGLLRILKEANVDEAVLRDPWDNPYRAAFFYNNQLQVFTLTSAGGDKRFDTNDDFIVERFDWYYFRSHGEAMDRAVRDYHARTGRFIRDRQTLSEELSRLGVALDSLRDPWMHPYKFEFSVVETRFLITVASAGPNGKFDTAEAKDDFEIWRSATDYFAEPRAQIDDALFKWVQDRNLFPQDETDLRAALRSRGISLEGLQDPWGKALYTVFTLQANYADRARIETRANFGEAPRERIDIKPVTQKLVKLNLRSAGADGKEGTADDFTAGIFSGTISEQSASEIVPQPANYANTFAGSTGAIRGVVTDPMGAVVPGAEVSATRDNTPQKFTTTTDDEGRYLLRNVPVGLYSLRIEANGFKPFVVDHVFVYSSNLVEVNASLDVGNVSETVSVVSEGSQVLNASTAAVSATVQHVNALVVDPRAARSKQQVATPRLREYFPETLVWQPALETDRLGRAQINFKLADNITTWKMAVFGSTEDGQIGSVEKEIKAFQPFFVEHDPPRVLTEGDEISLPVVVRNYLERSQAVDLDIKPENWFTLLEPARKRVEVAAGDATLATFGLRITGSVKDGGQRITAIAQQDSDAIEKPVTTHPDGEEQTTTASDVIGENATLSFKVSPDAIPNSAHAELKIYPNLLGHVAESVEAIMKRPYGCGEQTISSTYPSLLLLRYYKQNPSAAEGSAAAAALRARAERYLLEGYKRLLNYQDEGGGFTYWGHGNPDLALTAYALRFLSEASGLIEVDEEVRTRASDWLISQRAADGSWPARYYWDQRENSSQTPMLTAYIARILALTQKRGPSSEQSPAEKPRNSRNPPSPLQQALGYLEPRLEQAEEPYLLASFALAALDAGETARAEPALRKLRTLAHTEGDRTYWSLETNTPFYSWGQAGRVETTALVIQALARSATRPAPERAPARFAVASASIAPISIHNATEESLTPSPLHQLTAASQLSSNAVPAPAVIANQPAPASSANQANDHLVRSGLLFLLKEKDRYGVWYSTQATINVLDALLLLLRTDSDFGSTANARNFADIVVNGQLAQVIPMPAANQFGNPISVDVSRFLRAANNQIEIRRGAHAAPASAQAVTTYYVPWPASSASTTMVARPGASSGMRLLSKFDRTEANVGDQINCHVEAERIGFRGYGMLLAEIGLPPGAEVDRESLERAIKSSDWAINQYDILPDRVVVYLWPRAGGVNFDFKIRPRFGLKAKTAPSVIYDYYNPEARAVIAPAQFLIK